MTGTLYIVGTPIGNLKDITYRAVDTLQSVDFIAAEDTRVSLKLLNHFQIKKPTISYFGHNMYEKGPQIITRILKGENCAIVTDAGMPCISDPGEELVKLAIENQIEIFVIPGPSAVISALCVSGLDTTNFTFVGFLTTSKSKRFKQLEKFQNYTTTLVFYEAPHKLIAMLRDLHTYFGDRKIAVAKELTKIHESVIRGSITDALTYFRANRPIGEFVLVVEGAAEAQEKSITLEEAVEMAKEEMKNGNKATTAAKIVAKQTNHKKSDIYKGLLDG